MHHPTLRLRRAALLLVVPVLAALAACGGHDEQDHAADAASTAAAAPAATGAAASTMDMSAAGSSTMDMAGADSTMAMPESTAAATSAMAAARTQYPVEITDCGGRTTTYEKAPERIATLDPAIAEFLIVLGLGDRIVGLTDFQADEARWARTKAEMDALPLLNDGSNYPSKEAIVATKPDIVMSIYPSGLLENKELPSREEWQELGVQSYLTLGECHLATTPLEDFSALEQDLRNLGVLFDVQDRAEAEIATIEERVAAAQAKAAAAGLPARTVWSYSGEDDPYPAGGIGTPNAVITLAGATNAFADQQRDYAAISWEEIVKRNPDVVWLMTAAGPGFVNEAEGIKKKLAADSRLAGVTAVEDGAYVIVSYDDAGVESPRNVDGLDQMVDGLIALG